MYTFINLWVPSLLEANRGKPLPLGAEKLKK
jgi:hypothetical protein